MRHLWYLALAPFLALVSAEVYYTPSPNYEHVISATHSALAARMDKLEHKLDEVLALLRQR